MTVESIVRIGLGFVVLLAGRNIFWLFIALVGFLAGAEVAGIWLAGHSPALILLAAIAAGLLGALLSMLFERVAFALAGFYAAAYIAILLAARLGLGPVPWLIVVGVGFLGALVAALVMDWSIIVLSSIAGAAAIVSGVAAVPAVELLLFLVLATLGVLVQRAVLGRRERA